MKQDSVKGGGSLGIVFFFIVIFVTIFTLNIIFLVSSSWF